MRAKRSNLALHLIKSVRGSSFIKAVPYKWVPRAGKFIYIPGRLRRFLFLAQFGLYILYMSFLFVSLILVMGKSDPDSKSRIMTLQYVACTYCVPLVLQWKYFRHYGEHHTLWNRFLTVVSGLDLERDRVSRGGAKYQNAAAGSGFHKILKFLKIGGVLVVTMNLASLVRKPDLPHMLTSLVPNVKEVPRYFLTPLILAQFWIYTYQWTTVYIGISDMVTYVNVMRDSLNLLRRKSGMTPEDFMETYRRLQLLQNNYDDLNSQFILQLETVAIVSSILSVYTGLRAEGPQGIRSLIIAAIFLFILLKAWIVFAEVHEVSVEVLHSWITPTARAPVFMKFLASVLPIRIRVGSFFYADRELVITIISVIIQNTTSLLIAE